MVFDLDWPIYDLKHYSLEGGMLRKATLHPPVYGRFVGGSGTAAYRSAD